MNQDTVKSTKKQAFLSFLEAPTTGSQQTQRKNNSDKQQYEEVMLQTDACIVCNKDIDPKKIKKCAFCNQPACSDHLRKRRIKDKKWQKICDNCQDKYLYDTYMKLQIKAEESLTIQQQIQKLKHDQLNQLVQAKRQKRRQLSFKVQDIKNTHNNKVIELQNKDNKTMSIQHKLQSDELQIKQMEQYLERIRIRYKQNYEEDFSILSQQNDKLSKQLKMLEKRCDDVRSHIERKEKQLEDAFDKWEGQQYRKSIIISQTAEKNKKKDNCQIF